jgi:1-acyl-sn-glycerol-3-phosphate acyltransferase
MEGTSCQVCNKTDNRRQGSVKKKGVSDNFYSPLFTLASQIVFWFTLFAVIIFDIIIGRLKVMGRENLRAALKKGAFLISNHTLYLDPALIAHAIAPYRTCFTAMEDTFSIKAIGPYIRCLGAFPVSETMPIRMLIDAVNKAHKKNWFVHFFPEGELIHLDHTLREFKQGVFYLAVLMDKPVVPVTIITKPRSCFSDALNRYFCKVEIIINKPLYPSDFKDKGLRRKEQAGMLSQCARNVIRQELKKRGTIVLFRQAGSIKKIKSA